MKNKNKRFGTAKPIKYFGDIKWLSSPTSGTKNHADYAKLAISASKNLGGNHSDTDLAAALNWLYLNAMETDEQGVVDEINFMLG